MKQILFIFVLTLTMTLSVSSLGKKTQTQRRSCMVLLLWKFSLFIFVWLGQDRPLCLQPGLWAHWWPASTTAGTDTTTTPCFSCSPVKIHQHLWAQQAKQRSQGRAWGPELQSATVETHQNSNLSFCSVWTMCSAVREILNNLKIAR